MNGVIAALVVMGGIGWRVTNDLWVNRSRLKRLRRLSLHSLLVMRSSMLVIVVGCLGLLFAEHFAIGGVMEALGLVQKFQVTLFQLIAARSAGFGTVPFSFHSLSDAGLLLGLDPAANGLPSRTGFSDLEKLLWPTIPGWGG